MKISVIRRTTYNGCVIYVMHFGNVFMRLFYWNGEIYENHVEFIPTLGRRILYWLGVSKYRYTSEQFDGARDAVLSEAIEAIDIIQNNKASRRKRKRKE